MQAEGSAAIANAWESGTTDISPVIADTVADSISADRPSDGFRALRAVRETGGEFVTVTDEGILNGMSTLARTLGVFSEPAAAAVYAGWLELTEHNVISPEEQVVLLVTGHGLKDIDAVLPITDRVLKIEPSLAALRTVLN